MYPEFLFGAQKLRRRQFVQTVGGLIAGAFGAGVARTEELPKNANPQAISGDRVSRTRTS
jgi:hypothetical protein